MPQLSYMTGARGIVTLLSHGLEQTCCPPRDWGPAIVLHREPTAERFAIPRKHGHSTRFAQAALMSFSLLEYLRAVAQRAGPGRRPSLSG
jgi:hypothetical protein